MKIFGNGNTRRYKDLDNRQESSVVHVYSYAELKSQLVNPRTSNLNRKVTIKLCADLICTETLILNLAYPIAIDGGDSFKISCISTFDTSTPFIHIKEGNVTFKNITLEARCISPILIASTVSDPIVFSATTFNFASLEPDAIGLQALGGPLQVKESTFNLSGESDIGIDIAAGVSGFIKDCTINLSGAKSSVFKLSGNLGRFKLDDVNLVSDGNTTYVFGLPDSDCTYFKCHGLTIAGFDEFAHEFSAAGIKWQYCSFKDITCLDDDCDIESNFNSCRFDSLFGFDNYFFNYGADNAYNTIVNVIGGNGLSNQFNGGSLNYITNVGQFSISEIDQSTSSLSGGTQIEDDFSIIANDMSYLRKTLVLVPSDITLNTAAPTLTHGDVGLINLTLGASASGSIALGVGRYAGQLLFIKCVSNAGTATLPDSGTNKLASTWNPDADDTIGLIFDGTNWIEITRSKN